MLAIAPARSYAIWFSQRVGSTLLSQALEDTGIAGRPREWFHAASPADVLAKYGVATPHELREVLWREGTTPNGVLGVKYGVGVSSPHHALETSLFASVASESQDPDGRKTWEAFFPSCSHIFMTRRNKFRLAVSWWRAIKSAQWHRLDPRRASSAVDRPPGLDTGAGERVPDLADQYVHEAIEHLFIEANLREVAIQEQFDRWGIVPLTVVYEDFVASFEPTVRGVLDFLHIPGRHDVAIPAPAFERLADDVSEDWYQRFRRERTAMLKEPVSAHRPRG